MGYKVDTRAAQLGETLLLHYTVYKYYILLS